MEKEGGGPCYLLLNVASFVYAARTMETRDAEEVNAVTHSRSDLFSFILVKHENFLLVMM